MVKMPQRCQSRKASLPARTALYIEVALFCARKNLKLALSSGIISCDVTWTVYQDVYRPCIWSDGTCVRRKWLVSGGNMGIEGNKDRQMFCKMVSGFSDAS